MLMVEPSLKIPYMEKKHEVQGLVVKSSIYKCVVTKRFYCQTVIINNGEYLFSEGASYSGYWTQEDVNKRDIAQECISEVVKMIMVRKRILSFICNNPNLPSVLGAAFNNTLILYVKDKGVLKTIKMFQFVIRVNLPPSEQIYLKDLMAEFNIKVERNLEELGTGNELY